MYKIIGADGKEYGPISLEVLRQWVAEGRANGQTRILPEGGTEWKTIAEVPELSSLPGSTPAIPAATPATLSVPAAAPRNNSLAVAGLTLGIISLTLGLCCCYGFPFSIPGIICSSIGLSQIKKDPLREQGKNLATVGLILSILSIVLGVLLLVFAVSLGSPDMLRRIRRL